MKDNVVIANSREIEPHVLDSDEVKGVTKRVLIGRSSGATNFFMRLFSLEPGGYSPLHRHSWEHEVFIVSGEVTVVTEEGVKIAKEGASVFVPGNALHQFRNETSQSVEFICVVPSSGEE
ncbi:MAG TPA: cupin domain-containing protein [Kosmotogaceae bacterium]|nr:cupin domain-containing protein [Kosmotogaceae bacterium]